MQKSSFYMDNLIDCEQKDDGALVPLWVLPGLMVLG